MRAPNFHMIKVVLDLKHNRAWLAIPQVTTPDCYAEVRGIMADARYRSHFQNNY